jgi:hypothetical protein
MIAKPTSEVIDPPDLDQQALEGGGPAAAKYRTGPRMWRLIMQTDPDRLEGSYYADTGEPTADEVRDSVLDPDKTDRYEERLKNGIQAVVTMFAELSPAQQTELASRMDQARAKIRRSSEDPKSEP